MATVRPFRALRYNTANPLAVAMVTAPPYDCISPDERDELYRLHPHNVVRLILGKDQPGDDPGRSKYTRSADLMTKWENAGILVRDAEPAVYFYQQEFEIEGKSYCREGILARVGLEEFGKGRIYPHEETLPGPRADRLQLLRATRANLSPVFGLYPDPRNAVPRLFEEVVRRQPLVQTVDGEGVVHRLFSSSDPGLVRRVAKALADKPIYIADGHHRYETALAFRRENPGMEDARNVMMTFVNMYSPGLKILATHRLVGGVDIATGGACTDWFTCANECDPASADRL